MGYDIDMLEYYDEKNQQTSPLVTGSMKFKKKNLISSNGVQFKTLMWNYICWVLAGKPDNWRIDGT